MIENINRIVRVRCITSEQETEICNYLLNKVLEWCANNGTGPNHIFFARDLVGGDYANWDGTPLSLLYYKYLENHDHNYAFSQAAKACGHLLKIALHFDTHHFRMSSHFTAGYYLVEK